MARMKKKVKKVIVAIIVLMIAVLLHQSVAKSTIPKVLSSTNVMQSLYSLAGTKKGFVITPLKGGMSDSTLYKIDVNNKSYVVRLIGNRSIEDRTREIQAQIIASDQGWGPVLYASDVDQGWIVMDYLKSIPLTDSNRAGDDLYVSLAKVLQRMHNGPQFLPGKPIVKEIKELLQKLTAQGKISPPFEGFELEAMIRSLEADHSPMLAPTHRDLNPNNIIFSDNQIHLIDFENAAQDDPFYDLACIGIFYIFDAYHEKIFLNAYFDRDATEREYAAYQTMKVAALLFYGLNFLNFVPEGFAKEKLVAIEPFQEMLQKISAGFIRLDDPVGQMMISQSFLAQAANQHALVLGVQ